MGLGHFIDDSQSTYGRDDEFIEAIDAIFPESWRDGRTQPYQFLSVVEQYLQTLGPDGTTRYQRARLDVARAYDVSERTIRRACEGLYTPGETFARDQFVTDVETLETRLTDE